MEMNDESVQKVEAEKHNA